MALTWPPTTPDTPPPQGILRGGTVIIRAGAGMQQRDFVVYKNALLFYSTYFHAQLTGNWAETQTGVVGFDDVDPEIMLQVIYFVTFRTYQRPAGLADGYRNLCSVWVLADRLGIPMLCNYMVNELRDTMVDSWTAPIDELDYIFEHTAPGAHLRKAVIYYTCRILGPELPQQVDLDEWPRDAVNEMLAEFAARLGQGEMARPPKVWLLAQYICRFHEHDGEDCPEDDEHQQRLRALW